MRAHAQRNARMQHAYTDALTHTRALMKTASILQLTERVASGDGSAAPLGCPSPGGSFHHLDVTASRHNCPHETLAYCSTISLPY